MEKIALTIWNDRISPVFDVSRRLLIADVEKGIVVQKSLETFTNDDPSYKVNTLKKLNINTLICGAVSKPLVDMLTTCGITTISFISGCYHDVISAYLSGSLCSSDFNMPGCRQRVRKAARVCSEKKFKRFMRRGL